MENSKTSVQPIGDKSFLTVPAKAWNELCDTLNKTIEMLDTANKKITDLESRIVSCDNDISEIAKILEELYNAQA